MSMRHVQLAIALLSCQAAYADIDMAAQVRQKQFGVFDGILHSVGSFFEKVGLAFRDIFVDPLGYYYNYAIFNDSNIDLTAGIIHQDMVLGGQFAAPSMTFISYAQSLYAHCPTGLLVTDPFLAHQFKEQYQTGSAESAYPIKLTDGVSTIAAQNINLSFNLVVADSSGNQILNTMMTQLDKHNNTRMYVYHGFQHKVLQRGRYVHVPAIECLGCDSATPGDLQAGVMVIGSSSILASQKESYLHLSDMMKSITIYNNTGTPFLLKLTYQQRPYACEIEPYSFAVLEQSATEPFAKNASAAPAYASLRPNVFQFFSLQSSGQYSTTPDVVYPLGVEGFANASYVLELYQDQGQSFAAGMQGFLPGHYDQPTTNIRNITPVTAVVWNQSAAQLDSADKEQAKKSQQKGQMTIDLPGQVWLASSDNSFQPFCVSAGQVASWRITRPKISQRTMQIYCLYLHTTDSVKALACVEKFVSGAIGAVQKEQLIHAFDSVTQPVINQYQNDNDSKKEVDPLSATLQVQSLLGQLPEDLGLFTDGIITGSILGTDIFTSFGTGVPATPVLSPSDSSLPTYLQGISCPYYYKIVPPVLQMAEFCSLVGAYLDLSTLPTVASVLLKIKNSSNLTADEQNKMLDDALQEALSGQIYSWITAYVDDPSKAKLLVEQFVLQYGQASLLKSGQGVDRSNVKALSVAGKQAVNQILTGPISLAYLPLQMPVPVFMTSLSQRFSWDGMPDVTVQQL